MFRPFLGCNGLINVNHSAVRYVPEVPCLYQIFRRAQVLRRAAKVYAVDGGANAVFLAYRHRASDVPYRYGE